MSRAENSLSQDNKDPKVTLAAVAREAAVSIATASMVLSGRVGVSFATDTVVRVREAALKLGYVTPRRRNTEQFGAKNVLIVCPNVLNPYYSTMIQGIQQAASEHGISTLIQTTYRSKESEMALLHQASESGLAGIIFTMMPQCVDLVERVGRIKPLVVIGDRNISLNVDTVELNNYDAGLMLARYMTALGHRHAAYISTPLNAANSARVRRLEGIQAAFSEVGGSVLVKEADVSPEQELGNIAIEHDIGFSLARECLADTHITALLAVNDMVAYGVLDAVADAGKCVPCDYSVCGFDNIFPSRFLPVGLTTVEHHLLEKSRLAFEILRARMLDGNSANVTRVEFRHHLIERGSTASPRKCCS